MIDFVSTSLYVGKDKPNFAQFNLEGVFPNTGFEMYTLQGCEKIKALWRPESRLLKISGSVPYFWNGHNFCFSTSEFVEAVDWLDNLLGGVGLWSASVEAVENGVVIPVEVKPKLIIQHHTARKGSRLIQNEKGKDAGNFRWWSDSAESVKMYDAKANFLCKQSLSRREVMAECGFDPGNEYLKFEAHIVKPTLLTGGKAFRLEYLQRQEWIQKLNDQLMNDYKRLCPMKSLNTPTDKKYLTSADLVLFAFANSAINSQGLSLLEVKKLIYQEVNLVPESVLSKADKDARKAQINKLFSRIEEADQSQWDLSEKLKEALDQEKPAEPGQKEEGLEEAPDLEEGSG